MLAVVLGVRTLLPAFHPGGTSAAPCHAAPCIGESCALGSGVRDVRLFVEPDAGVKPITSAIAALEDARRRGVSVRLILPGTADIAAADVAWLKAGGVQLVYVSAPFIHAKVIVADGRLAFVGSENFSSTSLDENREVGLLLSDTTALAMITTTFKRDWAVGQPA